MEFQIGDRVKIVSLDDTGISHRRNDLIGQHATIAAVNPDADILPYEVRMVEYEDYWFFGAKNLERA